MFGDGDHHFEPIASNIGPVMTRRNKKPPRASRSGGVMAAIAHSPVARAPIGPWSTVGWFALAQIVSLTLTTVVVGFFGIRLYATYLGSTVENLRYDPYLDLLGAILGTAIACCVVILAVRRSGCPVGDYLNLVRPRPAFVLIGLIGTLLAVAVNIAIARKSGLNSVPPIMLAEYRAVQTNRWHGRVRARENRGRADRRRNPVSRFPVSWTINFAAGHRRHDRPYLGGLCANARAIRLARQRLYIRLWPSVWMGALGERIDRRRYTGACINRPYCADQDGHHHRGMVRMPMGTLSESLTRERARIFRWSMAGGQPDRDQRPGYCSQAIGTECRLASRWPLFCFRSEGVKAFEVELRRSFGVILCFG
jgi:hypothetical protein